GRCASSAWAACACGACRGRGARGPASRGGRRASRGPGKALRRPATPTASGRRWRWSATGVSSGASFFFSLRPVLRTRPDPGQARMNRAGTPPEPFIELRYSSAGTTAPRSALGRGVPWITEVSMLRTRLFRRGLLHAGALAPFRVVLSLGALAPARAAELPPFPFFDTPEGLQSAYREGEREIPYEAHYFMQGDTPVLVEGRIFRDKFNLAGGGRKYSATEFHRNYQNAIEALGGKRISTSQYPREVVARAGGRQALEQHLFGAVAIPDYRHESYLLTAPGKEYWIEVSTGAIPLHGYVVV